MKWLSSTLVLLCSCGFLLVCAGCGKKAADSDGPKVMHSTTTDPTKSTVVPDSATPTAPTTDASKSTEASQDPADPGLELPPDGPPPDMSLPLPKAPKPGVRLPD